MKKYLVFFCVLFSVAVFGQSTVTLSVADKGIAPIPAFSIKDPALFVFTNLQLGERFSFDPNVSFNLGTGRGWFLDTWLRYHHPFDSAKRFVATVGFDYSMLYEDVNDISRASIYPTYQAKFTSKINDKNILSFDSWFMSPIKKDKKHGVSGNYLSFEYSRIEAFRYFILIGTLNPFRIDYTDGSKGFVNSYKINLLHKTGLFLGGQYIHSVSPKENTKVISNWNISIGITRKIKTG